MNWFRSGNVAVTGFSQHGNERPGRIKGGQEMLQRRAFLSMVMNARVA
jgi:hypothetical protein